MTKKIKIPVDYDKEFRIGVNLFNEEKYGEAIQHLEAAYRLNQSFDIHRLLVICYIEHHDFTQAKETIRERLYDYTSDHEGRMIYLSVLKQTHEFVTAHMFIHDYQAIDPELTEQLPLLQRDEEYLYAYHAEKYRHIMEEMHQLATKSPMEQQQIVKNALYLPVKYYKQVVLPLLVSRSVNVLIRAHLLENLHHLDYKKQVSYLLFNGEQITVVPAKLQDMLNSKSYVQLETQIEIELASKPDMKRLLLQELPLMFAILYPYPEHFIHNTERFLHAMLYRYGVLEDKEKSRGFRDDIRTLNDINAAQCQLYQA